MKTYSKFSDSSIDVYNGKRRVTHGWAIFNENGERVASGHSIGKDQAHKTAANQVRQWAAYNPVPNRMPRGVGFSPSSWTTHCISRAGAAGYPATYAGLQQMRADIVAKRDAYAAKHRIEVVEVVSAT